VAREISGPKFRAALQRASCFSARKMWDSASLLPHPRRACPRPRSRRAAPVVDHARRGLRPDKASDRCEDFPRPHGLASFSSPPPQPPAPREQPRPVRAPRPPATSPPRATSTTPTARGNRAPLPVAGLHQGASLLLNLLLKVTCYRASWKLSSSISCVSELSQSHLKLR
jgi:hypothetical protein